jgi:hypothetical protein
MVNATIGVLNALHKGAEHTMNQDILGIKISDEEMKKLSTEGCNNADHAAVAAFFDLDHNTLAHCCADAFKEKVGGRLLSELTKAMFMEDIGGYVTATNEKLKKEHDRLTDELAKQK